MPIVNGDMYPELKIHPVDNKRLIVAIYDISDEDAISLAHKVAVATAYIEEKFTDLCGVQLYIRSSDKIEAQKQRYSYETFEATGDDREAIHAFAAQNNIDVLHSRDVKLIRGLYKDNPSFELSESQQQLELEIEAFFTGKNISWSLNSPAWNSTWLNKSSDNLSLTNILHGLLNAAQGKLQYSQKQIGLVRALLNKAGHIRHCEENLISFVQRKNYSARNCIVQNSYGYDDYYDYRFELNYHLGNYYFLMSGCLDILGRLLADLFGITINNTVKPNIERGEFLAALQPKSQALYDIYSEETLNRWAVALKRKRNYVAHESEASYTTISKPKKKKISDSEVKKKVEGLRNWNAMRLLVGDDAVESNMRFAEFVIRMNEDNEVLTKDAMQFTYYDSATRTEQMALFHPLIDIKFDYEMIERILNQTASVLRSSEDTNCSSIHTGGGRIPNE